MQKFLAVKWLAIFFCPFVFASCKKPESYKMITLKVQYQERAEEIGWESLECIYEFNNGVLVIEGEGNFQDAPAEYH
ncbi:MAG: hypothetical protein H0U44_01175 [Flavisolibacter sp.]|nr:hypothetical protein [Flavisolibacter sp.]